MKIKEGMLVKFKDNIDNKFINTALAGKIATIVSTDMFEDNILEVRLIDFPKSSTVLYKMNVFDCVIPTFKL